MEQRGASFEHNIPFRILKSREGGMESNYRGFGDICHDIAENVIFGDIGKPYDHEFTNLELIFSRGTSCGGDWLWQIDHLPNQSGYGEFDLWIASDIDGEFKEWETRVVAEEFFDCLLEAIKKYHNVNPSRADRMKLYLPYLKERLKI